MVVVSSVKCNHIELYFSGAACTHFPPPPTSPLPPLPFLYHPLPVERTPQNFKHYLLSFFSVHVQIRSEVGQVFALSWLITWYGHVLKDFTTIVRLYDFFLATHPLMPVYFGAAVSLFPFFRSV